MNWSSLFHQSQPHSRRLLYYNGYPARSDSKRITASRLFIGVWCLTRSGHSSELNADKGKRVGDHRRAGAVEYGGLLDVEELRRRVSAFVAGGH